MGAIFALWKGDSYGRLRMIQLGALTMILGVIIQVTSFAGRFCE